MSARRLKTKDISTKTKVKLSRLMCSAQLTMAGNDNYIPKMLPLFSADLN